MRSQCRGQGCRENWTTGGVRSGSRALAASWGHSPCFCGPHALPHTSASLWVRGLLRFPPHASLQSPGPLSPLGLDFSSGLTEGEETRTFVECPHLRVSAHTHRRVHTCLMSEGGPGEQPVAQSVTNSARCPVRPPWLPFPPPRGDWAVKLCAFRCVAFRRVILHLQRE